MDDPFSLNIAAVGDLVESDTNKAASSGAFAEGATGDRIDVLDLPMSDEELIKLRNDWEALYAPYETRVAKAIAKRNLPSYLGRSKDGSYLEVDAVVAANLQFEAEETFLPAAMAQQPAPFVYSDNTPEGNLIADSVQTMLEFHADQLLLNRKLAIMVRQWSIYHLGVLKPGWDSRVNDVAVDNRKIQDFVFDPNGYVDAYGDFSSYLGERITVTAGKLIELFPKHSTYIKEVVEDKLGTDCTYTQWWNDDYSFTTFKEKVLEKHKNEYFNYEDKNAEPDPMTGQMPEAKRNHFAFPKKPYVFMSVFSLQERPHDLTGLIEQNIPNQASITRQTDQIDYNVASSNNGFALSENNFNQETGKQAANARRKGNPILIPAGGPVNEAIVPLPATPLPNSFFESLENHKNDLRSSWGTQGISSQEQKPDTTARGMVMNATRDTSRIGGGIGDVVEQSVARSVFNWLVQLYMVFYDEQHFGAVMGQGKATDYVKISGQQIDRQLIVGVTPNSMKPKDELSKINQAIQLFQEKAIGPKTLLETLDFPNPDDAAGDGVLYAIDPMSYFQLNFPDLAQKVQQFQQQQMQMQQQAQQAQMQQEAQSGQADMQQKQAAGEQQLQQKEAGHQQALRQGEEQHQAKLKQSTEAASAKMANMKTALPK
jgi:hypothetical protein